MEERERDLDNLRWCIEYCEDKMRVVVIKIMNAMSGDREIKNVGKYRMPK